jgi:O-antigen/teichoic acid export membrane protein
VTDTIGSNLPARAAEVTFADAPTEPDRAMTLAPAPPISATAAPLVGARAFAVKVMGGASLQAVTAVVYGVATVLVARHVGPSVFGQLAVGTIFALVGADVLDLGRNSLLVRMQAQGLVPTRELSRRLIMTKLAWSPVLLIALLVASLVMTHHVHLYMLLFYVYGISYTIWQTLVTPFRGEAELMRVSSCAAQERLITLGVVLAGQSLLGPATLAVGLALGSLSVCARLTRTPFRDGPAPMSMREFTRASRPFAVVSLTSDAQQLDVPLVVAAGGTVAAGIFAAASRLIGPLSLVVVQTSQLVFARAARVDDPLKRRQAVLFVAGIAAIYVPGLALVSWRSDDLIGLLLGPRYAESAHLLGYISIGVVLTILTYPLTAWMQGRGRSKVAAVASTSALVGYFVVLLLGAAHDSLTIVALAYSVMQLVNLGVLGGNILIRRIAPRRQGRHRMAPAEAALRRRSRRA